MNRTECIDKPVRGWLVYSITLPTITFLAVAAWMSIPPDTAGVDVAEGRHLFVAHCGPCHFDRQSMPAHHAPNLFQIGRTAAGRKPNQSAAEYLLESVLEPDAFIAPGGRPGMPSGITESLAPDQIRNLIGYLAGRGAIPDYSEIAGLEIPDRRAHSGADPVLDLAEITMAETVLREKGQCLNCHSIHNSPEDRVFFPPLFAAGLTDLNAVRESIVEPNKSIPPTYQSSNVLLVDGQVVSGCLIAQTEDQLLIVSRDQQNQITLRKLLLEEIEQSDGVPVIKESSQSLMPNGYAKLLSDQEIEAVVKLIRQLN